VFLGVNSTGRCRTLIQSGIVYNTGLLYSLGSIKEVEKHPAGGQLKGFMGD
jgi:hypothetical protein